MKAFLSALLIAALTFSVFVEAEERSYIRPSQPDAEGPAFSGAVKVGDTLYLSGELGLDKNQKIPEAPKAEAQLLLKRFANTLAEAGYTMDDLVYVTVYCSDVKYYADWNAVYRSHFKKEFPSRAFVGAGPLLFGARFEMQGIAIKR
jgi:enamine deaminase RidA (YjgF/YER057c/UK114 family)